jgi:hypothetical protein
MKKEKLTTLILTILLFLALPIHSNTNYNDNFNGGNQTNWMIFDAGDNSTYLFQNNRYELHTESGDGSAKSLVTYINESFNDSITQIRIQKINQTDNFLTYIVKRMNTTTMSAYVCGASSDGSHIWFGKLTGGVYSNIASDGTVPSYNSSDFNFKCQIIDNKLFAKVWNYSTPEPIEWQINTTDNDYVNGKNGIMLATYPVFSWNNVSVAIDDFNTTTLSKSVVYVNDDWTGNATYTEIEPEKILGYNAFTNIQYAVNNVTEGGIVYVANGTYNDQVIITKPVTLKGENSNATIIDGEYASSPAITKSGQIRINTNNGEVNISGFTITQPVYPPGGWDMCMVINSGTNTTINVYDCLFIGYNYNIYSSGSYANLSIYNNVFNHLSTGGNTLLFEKSFGTTNLYQNEFYNGGPIVFMSYNTTAGPNDITEKQWIHDNYIDCNGTSGIAFVSAIGMWGYNEYNNGSFTNINISDNIILNVGDNEKGIQLEVDGDGGGIYNAIIQRNIISSQNPGILTSSRGIRFLTGVVNATVTENNITGFYRGFWQSYSWGVPGSLHPSNNKVQYNNFINCYIGIQNQYTEAENIIDARFNWWENSRGPGGDGVGSGNNVTGNITYSPWYNVFERTTLSTYKNNSNYTKLNSTINTLVVTNKTDPLLVQVINGTTNAYIDYIELITNGNGTLPETNISSEKAYISIPIDTNISCTNTSWEGIIKAPTITIITLPETPGYRKQLSTAIEIGISDTKLSFDRGVRILLLGEANKKVGWVRTGEQFTEITTICDSDNQTTGDDLTIEGDCKINSGDDLVIWTKHFTTFATYTQTAISQSSSKKKEKPCETEWECTEWSECIDGTQTRECYYDKDLCTPIESKPVETQDCVEEICETKWECSDWSECIDGLQNRICYYNQGECMPLDEPIETQECIVSRDVLFDINLDVSQEIINTNESLSLVIGLINLGVPGQVNVTMHYLIEDSLGNTIYNETEIISVETQKEFIKNIDTREFEPGEYTVKLDMEYVGQVEPAEAEDNFKIAEVEKELTLENKLLCPIIVFIVLLILIWFGFKYIRKQEN